MEQITTSAGRPLRVLGVEDNAVNKFVLKSILELLGAETTIVENGLEAVDAWEREDWDLILMDIQMPVMDGLDATREIRRREAVAGRRITPIVALSANVMTHQVSECLGVGMDEFVAKPIDIDRLRNVIVAVVGAKLGGMEVGR